MWNRTRDLQTVTSQWGVVTVRQYNLVFAWLALPYVVMAATTSLSFVVVISGGLCVSSMNSYKHLKTVS